MVKRYLVELVAVYKILTNLLRLTIGTMIFFFRGDLEKIIFFLSRKELIEDPKDFFFNFLFLHIHNASVLLTFLLASALIIFSVFEIIFAIELYLRRKRGAIGLFVISLLWVPFEILFISKFLIVHQITGIILDVIVLAILLRIIQQFHKNGKSKFYLR